MSTRHGSRRPWHRQEPTISRVDINVSLVRKLLTSQFPQWADLPITAIEFDGWDNRTFRLGEEMSVRLPSAGAYAAQVGKEHTWLPRLAPHLPLPVPTPLAIGIPDHDYPWHWSVYQWIEGENATINAISDLPRFAVALARFLTALQQIDSAGGPAPGKHNFFRGGDLAIYDDESRRAITALSRNIDTRAVTDVWETALEAKWHGTPFWLHGDVSSTNLLVNKGRLSAVIDFGCSGVGDPACDLAITWTFFFGKSREAFRNAINLDAATWARGRGWAIWKGLITLAKHQDNNQLEASKAMHTIDEVLVDHS